MVVARQFKHVKILLIVGAICSVFNSIHLSIPAGTQALPPVPGGCTKVKVGGRRVVSLTKAGDPLILDEARKTWMPLRGPVRTEAAVPVPRNEGVMVQQVWGIQHSGAVVVRNGVDKDHPHGTGWKKVDFADKQARCISVGLNKVYQTPEIWVVATDNTLWRRTGTTFFDPIGTAWKQIVDNQVRLWVDEGRQWQVWGGTVNVSFRSVIVSSEGDVVAVATVTGDPRPSGRPMILTELSDDGVHAKWQMLGKGHGDSNSHGNIVAVDGKKLLVLYVDHPDNNHIFSWETIDNRDDNIEYGWDATVSWTQENGRLALSYRNGRILMYVLGENSDVWIGVPGGEELSFTNRRHGVFEKNVFNMARVAANNLGYVWMLGSRGDFEGNPHAGDAYVESAGGWHVWVTTKPANYENPLGVPSRGGWITDFERDGVVQKIENGEDGSVVRLKEIATCHRPVRVYHEDDFKAAGVVAGQLTTPLIDIDVAAEGTVWGIGADGVVYRRSYADGTWQKYVVWKRKGPTILDVNFFEKENSAGKPVAISVGSPDEVWVVTDQGDLFRKTDAALPFDGGWLQAPGSYRPVLASGNDGELWVVDHTNRALRKVLRDRHCFSFDEQRTVVLPTELFHHPIKCIAMTDKHNVVLVTDDDYKIFRLSFKRSIKENIKRPLTEKNKSWPPKEWIGKEVSDWEEVFPGEMFSVYDAAVGDNGEIVVCDEKGNLFVRPPDAADTEMLLDRARGPVVLGNQLLNIGTVSSHNTFKGYEIPRWLWTNSADIPVGFVVPSASGKKELSNMMLMHRDHSPDDPAWIREWMGFFSMTHVENENSHEPIKYGDKVHIYSAATPPEGKLSTEILAKQRQRWVVYNNGASWCPVIVADKTHPCIAGGNDLFEIQSTDGSRQGEPVRARDAFKIISHAPYQGVTGRPLWVDDRLSPWGGEFHGVVKVSVGMHDYDAGYLFGGCGDKSGSQLLTAQVLNQVTDVWDVTEGDKVKQGSPRDTYNKLKGNYFQDEGFVKKEKVVAKYSQEYGRGLLTQIDNQTPFPLSVTAEEPGKPVASLATIAKEESYDVDDIAGDLRKKAITLKGFAQTDAALSYTNGMQIELGSMGSQGTLWCERALAKPGNATIVFVGLAGADGNLQLVFDTFDAGDDDHTLKPRLRIALGHHLSDQVRNAEAAIIFADRKVASTTKDQNIFASVPPGTPMPYWVTLNDGFIAVGLLNEKGFPGDNLILAAYIPEVATFNKFGFSSHREPVMYADVRVGQQLGPVVEGQYLTLTQAISLPAMPGALTFLNIPTNRGMLSHVLRVQNEGSITFTAKAQHSVSTVFASEDSKGKPSEYYEVVYAAESNASIQILKKTKKDAAPKLAYRFDMADLPDLQFSTSHPTQRLWISLQGGTFMIGHITAADEGLGSNVIAAWNDPQLLSGISRIGFRASDHAQTISNIVMAPPVDLGPQLEEAMDIKKLDTTFYTTRLIPFRPCYYTVYQKGAFVGVKDMIGGQTFPVVATAVPKAIYPFIVTMGRDGIPMFIPIGDADMSEAQRFAWAAEDEVVDKINAFNRSAMEASAKATYIMSIADTTMRGVESATNLAAGAAGMAMQGGPIGAAIGAGLIAGAVGVQTAASVGYGIAGGFAAGASKEATQQAYEAQALQDQLALKQQREAIAQQTAAGRQINLQQVSRAQQLSGQVPEVAQVHQANVIQALAQLQQVSPSNPDQLDYYLTTFLSNVLTNIDHPFVVQDSAVKQNVLQGLQRIMDVYDTIPEQFQHTVFKILCLAYGNEYVTDRDSRADIGLREAWYGKIVELGQSFMMLPPEEGMPPRSLMLQGLRGEYVWHFAELSVPDKGWVTFEVAAPGPLFVAFGSDNDRVQGIGAFNSIYEIVLGIQDPESKTGDQMHVIRVKNLGRAGKILREKENRKAMLERGWNSMWIRLNHGLIEVGKGNKPDDKTVIMSWQDPYPWEGIRFVGFSSWDGRVPVAVRSIMLDSQVEVAGPVEEEDKAKQPALSSLKERLREARASARPRSAIPVP